MYLRDLARSLLRRWYLVIVGLAAVGWLSVNVYGLVPPTYEARANVLLLPPELDLEPGDNPYLALSGLDQPLEVLQQLLNSGATRDDLLASLPRADYTVAEDPSTNSPIILLSGTAPSEAEALAALTTVLDALPTTLREMQDRLEIAPVSQVRSVELTVDDEARLDESDRVKAFLAVGAVGTAVVTLLIGAIDALALARRRRKAAKGAATTQPRAEDEPERTDAVGDALDGQPDGRPDEPAGKESDEPAGEGDQSDDDPPGGQPGDGPGDDQHREQPTDAESTDSTEAPDDTSGLAPSDVRLAVGVLADEESAPAEGTTGSPDARNPSVGKRTGSLRVGVGSRKPRARQPKPRIHPT